MVAWLCLISPAASAPSSSRPRQTSGSSHEWRRGCTSVPAAHSAFPPSACLCAPTRPPQTPAASQPPPARWRHGLTSSCRSYRCKVRAPAPGAAVKPSTLCRAVVSPGRRADLVRSRVCGRTPAPRLCSRARVPESLAGALQLRWIPTTRVLRL